MNKLFALFLIVAALACGQSMGGVATGSGAPTSGCAQLVNVGSLYARTNALATSATLYVCSQTASSTYAWELVQFSPSGVMSTTAANTITYAPVASTSSLLFSSGVFSGGTATTTVPMVLFAPSGLVGTNWTTTGTFIGMNAPASCTSDFLNFQVNNSLKYRFPCSGQAVFPSGLNAQGTVSSVTTITSQGSGTFTPNTGAGTTPTNISLGNSVDGVISLTTGTTPAAASAVISLGFPTNYPSSPSCSLTPGNANAAALSGAASVWLTTVTTGLTLNVGSTALAAATPYIWFYVCMK